MCRLRSQHYHILIGRVGSVVYSVDDCGFSVLAVVGIVKETAFETIVCPSALDNVRCGYILRLLTWTPCLTALDRFSGCGYCLFTVDDSSTPPVIGLQLHTFWERHVDDPAERLAFCLPTSQTTQSFSSKIRTSTWSYSSPRKNVTISRTEQRQSAAQEEGENEGPMYG